MHEMRRLLAKVMKDEPGCSPDAVIKVYDRDDFNNSVLTQGSQFENEHPWFPWFGATHLEDVH
eukprot:8983277-Karenia_brevis.AAC.1